MADIPTPCPTCRGLLITVKGIPYCSFCRVNIPEAIPESTAEEVFNKAAADTMVEWDMPGFRKEFPTLYKTILLAMEQYKQK